MYKTPPSCRFASPPPSSQTRRFASPSPSIDESVDEDISYLNTPAANVVKPESRRKSTFAIRRAFNRKIRQVDAAAGNTAGLQLLISDVRGLIAQKWETLVLYFQRDEDYPDCARLWSKTEWRKWDVVESLTSVVVEYGAACEAAAKEYVKLCSKKWTKSSRH